MDRLAVISLLALVAVAFSQAQVIPGQDQSYDPNPQYSYGYSSDDPTTGNFHGQTETRQGDVVQGSYSLLEADGSRRIVDYTADPVNGFNANVHGS